MITTAVMAAAQTHLQAKYVAAGSACVVVTDWPDPVANTNNETLVLAEGQEDDEYRSNGMRFNSVDDILYATYYQRAVSEQTGVSVAQAQATMRLAKTVLSTAYQTSIADRTLSGAVLHIGRVIKITHPINGPFANGSDTAGRVRFTFRAAISINPNPH